MQIIHWIEDQLDRITPLTEVTAVSQCTFSPESFVILINELISQLQLSQRSVDENEYILNYPGRSAGTLEQAKILIGKPAKPKMYECMKSKLRCKLLCTGAAKISSFEHMAGFKQERTAFKTVLEERLDLVLTTIESVNTHNQKMHQD